MNKIDHEGFDPIGKWILEAGLESPKSDFQLRIMQRIASKKEKHVYKPVISPSGFRWIGFGLLSFFMGVLIFVPPSNTDQNF